MLAPARPPSLKYALLGLLGERRGYGYELAQRLGRRAGSAWQTTSAAVYEALRQLEKDGLARPVPASESRVAPVGVSRRGSPRIPWEITEAGVQHLREWMASPCTVAPQREDLHLRLALSGHEHLPRLIEITIEQEQECLRTLDEHRGAPAFEELRDQGGPYEAFAAVAIRDGEVAGLEARVHWLRRVRKTLQWMLDNPERFLQRRR